MLSRLFIVFIICVLCMFGISINSVSAEVMQVEAMGEYDVGGNDTRENAKTIALNNAKRNALEQVAVNIESRSDMLNGIIQRDVIISYAKGKLKILGTPKYTFSNDGKSCIVLIQAIVDVNSEELKNYNKNFNPNSHENKNEINNINKAHANILKGAILWQGHYYKIFNMPIKWEDANIFCKKYGGHLATAETEEENEKIKSIFMENGGIKWCWIGGKRNNNRIWEWVTGKTIAEYSDWAIGAPREALQFGGPYLSLHNRENGKWENGQKRESHAFMCEWDSADVARDGDM